MLLLAVIGLLALGTGGCSLLRPVGYMDLPPVLSQDELTRPYTRLGRIQVTRESYWTDHTANPEIKEWAYNAIQREAGKMGADAVIHVEVDGGTTVFGLLPTTEYRATGIAIKFK